MSFPTVLGYSENIILKKYQKKYFQSMIEVFSQINISPELKEAFLSLDNKVQQEFILHPDISSVIREYQRYFSSESLDTLQREVWYFLSRNYDHITSYKWSNIPQTNIKLTDIDNNPQSRVISHPDHDQDGMLWWWERSESEWLEVFGKSFSLLKEINIEFYNELNFIIKKIVPMKTSIDVHNSCSHGDCIGTLYLWYTIDSNQPELNILEALIHESSHNKLNLIMQIEPLHRNEKTEKYYSPYRPDARPIHGVLLWVHAIVPTVYVMLQAIEQWYITDIGWHEKIVLYHIKNKLGYRVLQKYADLTGIGKQIVADMWSVIALCDHKIKSHPDLQKLNFQQIQLYAKSHFLEVQQNYPYLQY